MQNDQRNTEGGIILDKSSVHTNDDQIDFKIYGQGREKKDIYMTKWFTI